MRQEDCVDALRISDAERQSVLKELEDADTADPRATRRNSKRYPYSVPEGLILGIEGATARFIVRPRDISTGGMSFLHGSFLHIGRACILVLKSISGERVLVSGRIVRARCVRGRVHEIGMQFDTPVDIDDFADARKPATALPALLVASAPPTTSYDTEALLLLTGQLQMLVHSGVPRDQLFQKLARIIAFLREGEA
jgi:hypothetical protein